ncbi:MAG: SMC-Scp complex subunit ScpB [Patescibacteria group bacterium]
MELSQIIEAILFWKGEPISIKKISEITKKNISEISEAVNILEENLSNRGVVLLRKGEEIMLGTKGEAGSLIESLIKEELQKDLGKAGLETLSIILYLGPVARSEIDYIRGVNSSFIVRNLLIRGLVERSENVPNKRGYAYNATFELLSYLGITKVEDLTEYKELQQELMNRKNEKERIDNEIALSLNKQE